MNPYRSTAALAVTLFACAMVGLAIHHVLEGGTCSSTGYTRYGPAPVCSSSSDAWGLVLPVGSFVVILAASLGAQNLFTTIGPMFLAIGLGAVTVSGANGASGPGTTFDVVFGGAFILPGAALLLTPVVQAIRAHARSDGRPRPSRAGPVALTVAACIVGIGAAFAAATLFPTERAVGRTGAGARITGPVRPWFAPDDITATNPGSLFRAVNFVQTLRIARFYFGAQGRLRSVLLVPGGADIAVELGPGSGKEIGIDSTGGYLSGPVGAVGGNPPTFPLAALHAATPAAIAGRLSKSGKLAWTRIDHMEATPTAAGGVVWRVYPVGTKKPYRFAEPSGSP